MAKDFFHQAAKNALIKDQWLITHDPFNVSYGGVNMAIDLGAEKLLAAMKGDQKIAVEVKSFLEHSSAISEFHTALGQYINYRTALKKEESDRILYLAIPTKTYDSFFSLQFTELTVEENQVKLMVFDVEQEVIVTWKN
ncbi:MAG: fatty-acid oxidation protein subunit alpha [Symploca sp. SIO1B1]|nr:fatty-acid oxidation protein subunit alpha [Symploca sp. SIO1A3]NER97213.1 fatty-acid oxidation protein subunit alpha [Symploca sp. SIO1B1]